MSVGFDPRVPYWISPDSYKDIPEAERPAFQFRRLNGAEFVELSSIVEYNGTSTADEHRKVFETFKIGLLDWRNQYDPSTGEQLSFAPDSLERVIDAQEAMNLIQARIVRGRLNADEKKT